MAAPQREVIRTDHFVADATEFILHHARTALAERGEFRLALSGGNTPRPVYEELARVGGALPWDRARITFGDERCVAPDDPQSNYRMARESLLLPASVPESSVARMRGELDPEIAAQNYQDQLDVLATPHGEIIYRHDLLLLGLGDDGHTASLFPGTSALDETSRRVVANFVPKFNASRLTFTLPLINHARQILFLVNAKHEELIDAVLGGDTQYPAARVQPVDGRVAWLIGPSA